MPRIFVHIDQALLPALCETPQLTDRADLCVVHFNLRGGEQIDTAQELYRRLKKLADEMDQYLASEYSIEPERPQKHDAWRKNHKPFHWFSEFCGIM